jgi:uncharacterized Zn finger protein (UPF0148 family)
MLQFECPACGKQLLVKNSREQALITCPRCHERFELEVEDEPEASADYDVLDHAEERGPAAAPDTPPSKVADAPPAGKVKSKKKKGKGKKKKNDGSVVPRGAGLMLVLGLVVVLGGSSFALYGWFTRPDPKVQWTFEEALKQIPKWGGHLERDPVRGVTSVSYVGMSGSFKYEYLEPLTLFKELRKLNLANTRTGDLSADYIKQLTTLEVLNLSSTNISDAGLKELKTLVNLQELYLDNTLITDNGLAALSGCKKLKRLSLTGALADGQELKAAIPGLQISKN